MICRVHWRTLVMRRRCTRHRKHVTQPRIAMADRVQDLEGSVSIWISTRDCYAGCALQSRGPYKPLPLQALFTCCQKSMVQPLEDCRESLRASRYRIWLKEGSHLFLDAPDGSGTQRNPQRIGNGHVSVGSCSPSTPCLPRLCDRVASAPRSGLVAFSHVLVRRRHLLLVTPSPRG